MKKIIVACGNGVATSQSVAFKVNKMLKARHIQAVVEAVNLRSLERELHGAIAYIEIMKTDREYEVPKIDGLAFLSGNNKDSEFEKLVEIIEKKLGDKNMKKVIVACGSGVATSQTVASKVNRLLKEKNVNAQVEAVDLKSVDRYLADACAYIAITKVSKEYPIPVINGIAFLTGMNQEAELNRLIDAINAK